MTEQNKIKEAFETIMRMCRETPCKQCPMSYCDGDGDYMCSFERRPPHSCELREVQVYEPHWEEFDVIDGYFTSQELEADYPYYDYIRFLNESKKHNAFGGWLHTNDNDWCMIPMCYIDNQLCTYCNRDKKTTPAIPTKIRFWRFKE